MYVLKHIIIGNQITSHLFEMTASEFRKAKAADTYDTEANCGDGHFHEHISGQRAHKYVKDGRIHSTPLYTDNGRIRYARDGY